MPSLYPVPETVNLHVIASCDQRCIYCFGRFPALGRIDTGVDWKAILDLLACAGVKRVNFSGGEPTLHPDIAAMLGQARSVGLITSIVTNGARLTDGLLELCDIVALSIDSADDAVNARLGRSGSPSYVQKIIATADRVHAAGRKLKVNSVICSLNASEDLSALYRRLHPHKLKLLQFTRVENENADAAAALEISPEAFRAFVRRHKSIDLDVSWIEAEDDSTIAKTYVMIDPSGRAFQHAPGGHRVSDPVLDVGLAPAMEQAGGYDRAAFERRGGHVSIPEVIRMKRDEELERLFDAYDGQPVALAKAIARSYSGDAGRLALAAGEWVRRIEPASVDFPPLGRDTGIPEALELLRALPSPGERYRALLEAAKGSRLVATFGINVLIALASVRGTPESWRAALERWCVAGGDLPANAAEDVRVHDAELAYSVASVALEAANAASAGKGPWTTREPLGLAAHAREQLVGIAVSRVGVKERLPEDDPWLEEATAEKLLTSSVIFEAARDALRASDEAALVPQFAQAIESVEAGTFDETWARALALLACSPRRRRVAEILAVLVRTLPVEDLAAVFNLLRSHARELFAGRGWGRGNTRRMLVPLSRALLERGKWLPREWWAGSFRPTRDELRRGIETFGDEAVDERTRDVLAEGLLSIAADPSTPAEVRGKAVEALGDLGHGDTARLLGKVTSDPIVGEVAKRVRKAIARTAKGHRIPSDVGIKLALGRFHGRAK